VLKPEEDEECQRKKGEKEEKIGPQSKMKRKAGR
jgi:hypothetical protein